MVLRRRACSEYSRTLGGDKELKSYWEDCGYKRRRYIPESAPLNVDNNINNNDASADIKQLFICFLWTSTAGQSHFHGKTLKTLFASLCSLALSLSVTQ